MRRDTLRALVGVGLVALVSGAATVWWETPELHMQTLEGRTVAHMEVLGEYPADITSISIGAPAREGPLWQVVADDGMAQVHQVGLSAGADPVDVKVYHGRLTRTVPPAGSMFMLEAGVDYTIKVCSADFLRLCRTASFRLPRR